VGDDESAEDAPEVPRPATIQTNDWMTDDRKSDGVSKARQSDSLLQKDSVQDRQTDRQKDGLQDRQRNQQRDGLQDLQKDAGTNRQKDGLQDLQKDAGTNRQKDRMKGSLLGPAFSNREIEAAASRHSAPFRRFDDFDVLAAEVARLLDEGGIIGWFQGRMEWGPRALGNRSILGDPRNPDMQKRMNLSIKFREGFRPFAPSVPVERAGEYFEPERPSPYMLFVAQVRESRRKGLPPGYIDMPWRGRLYCLRSDIPAVTHIDFSARLQTVDRQDNQRYWLLLKAFEKRTGCAVLVNTSFNVRGEPIVCTPDDAYG